MVMGCNLLWFNGYFIVFDFSIFFFSLMGYVIYDQVQDVNTIFYYAMLLSSS